MHNLVISLLVTTLLSTGVVTGDTTTLESSIEQSIESKLDLDVLVEQLHEKMIVEEEKGSVVVEKDLRFIDLGDKFKFRQGVVSEEVRDLRYFLKEMGYSVDINSFSYDSSLMSVIKDYQKSRSIGVDGYAGKETLGVINKDIKENGIYIPEQVLVIKEGTNIPEGNWLIINKSNNTLYHMKGKEVLGKYHVATGKDASYTPEGKFSIVIKLVNPAWGGAGRYKPIAGGAPNNPLGKRWLGLSIGGGGTYGIHGNADFNSIGKYASLGCIRMYNDEVEALFDKISKGTEVWIGRTEKLQEFGITLEWGK